MRCAGDGGERSAAPVVEVSRLGVWRGERRSAVRIAGGSGRGLETANDADSGGWGENDLGVGRAED